MACPGRDQAAADPTARGASDARLTWRSSAARSLLQRSSGRGHPVCQLSCRVAPRPGRWTPRPAAASLAAVAPGDRRGAEVGPAEDVVPEVGFAPMAETGFGCHWGPVEG